MNLEKYQHMWDGSEPGWQLYKIDKTSWTLTIEFGHSGPTKKELMTLHKIIPELRSKKITDIYRELKTLNSYESNDVYGNIEAREIYELAQENGLNANLTSNQSINYIPVCKDNMVTLIEDDEVADKVKEKMLAAGVTIVNIHHD